MITPTKTVCYVAHEKPGDEEWVKFSFRQFERWEEFGWLGDIRRIIVREEVIEQQRPQYPWCNKNFNPLNPCECGDCSKVLAFYSKVKEAKL